MFLKSNLGKKITIFTLIFIFTSLSTVLADSSETIEKPFESKVYCLKQVLSKPCNEWSQSIKNNSCDLEISSMHSEKLIDGFAHEQFKIQSKKCYLVFPSSSEYKTPSGFSYVSCNKDFHTVKLKNLITNKELPFSLCMKKKVAEVKKIERPVVQSK